MARIANISLTEAGFTALLYIHNYRYLSVSQVATISDLKAKSASEMLLKMERQKLLGSFGNTGIRGYGKTPKIYYLTKSGYALLAEECDQLGIEIEDYHPIKVTSRWSPVMYHRLATLDVMMAVEKNVSLLEEYRLERTFVEYRREKIKGKLQAETTDYIPNVRGEADRIVPDAGFVLRNQSTERSALFLIEIDCGTERLTTRNPDAVSQTFTHKLNQYDRYIASGQFGARYAAHGDFNAFTCLIITETPQRIANMRQAAEQLNRSYDGFYRFTTQEAALAQFFGSIWLKRSSSDDVRYPLIRGAHDA